MGKQKPVGGSPQQFTVKEALAHKVTPGQLRGKLLHAPFHGVRTREEAATTVAKARALATALSPRAFFVGTTAAAILGAPLPALADERLQLAVPHGLHPPERAGVRSRRLRIEEDTIIRVDGVRVTRPARTWCDLGAELALADLVAVGDFLLHHRHVAVSELERAVDRVRIGRPRLREALALLDAGAESHPESIIRVALLQAGIGPIEANASVYDANGVLIGRPDLMLRRPRVLIEYLGDYHRVEKGRWRKDRIRCGRFRAAGWTVIELVADHLLDLPGVIQEVLAAAPRESDPDS